MLVGVAVFTTVLVSVSEFAVVVRGAMRRVDELDRHG
jgi:hypothetical protein